MVKVTSSGNSRPFAARNHDKLFSVIVLCPKAEVVAARDRATKTGYADETMFYAFERILHTETPGLGYWLDSTNLTVEETVNQILTNACAQSR